MRLILQRYSDDGNSTLGLLFKVITLAGTEIVHFLCDTLEDEFREVKLKGETRIPAGEYELKIRKEDTPLTIKHRKSYGEWFKYHIEVTSIPNFTGVYFHAGNTDNDTAGCILLGFGSQRINGIQSINNSKLATKQFYGECYDQLEHGEKVTLEIRDEIKLLS